MINEIAQRYGQALFLVAKENDSVSAKKEMATALLESLETNEDFILFLEAVKIDAPTKKETISKTFQDVFDADFINLLKLLVDKDRVYILKDILKSYIALANDDLGVLVANITSARALDQDDLETLRSALETRYQKTIEIKTKVDPSLIAGIKVKVGNTVTDLSLRRKWSGLKESLLKGGQV